MDVWNLIAERKIQEAMDEGAFDNLEGAGLPISEDVNPYEDPAQRMANRLMKNAGISPAWIVEARELDREIERLSTTIQDSKTRRHRVAELNRRITLFNLKVPVRLVQKLLIED